MYKRLSHSAGIQPSALLPASAVNRNLWPLSFAPRMTLVSLYGCVFGSSFTLEFASTPLMSDDSEPLRAGDGVNAPGTAPYIDPGLTLSKSARVLSLGADPTLLI